MDTVTDLAWRPAGPPWLIATVVTLASFMELLDTTIVNVCLPNIAGSLSVSFDDATWTLTSYLVANGIVLAIAGWIGRVMGRKRYFLTCIALFTVFSFLCGISTSLPQLVIFRLLQGICGGGLQPNQQAIVLDTFEPSQRGRAFSIVAIAVIFAPIIAPALGGWITDSYSWRWVFFINIPIGIIAFFSCARMVEDPPWVARDRARPADVDYVGLSLIAIGIGCLQIMLDRGEDWDWFSSPAIRTFAWISATALAAAIAWLLLIDKPVVNLRAFADRNFAVGVAVLSTVASGLYASNLLIPAFAQQWMGYTALLAGWLLTPGTVVMILLIPFINSLFLPNFQTRRLIAFGFIGLAASALWARRLTPDIDFVTLALFRAIQNVGLAFLFVPNSIIAYSTLPRSLYPDATALYAMFRNLSGSIGISVITATLSQHLEEHRAYLAAHLSPYNQAYNDTLANYVRTLKAMGNTALQAQHAAMGLLNHVLDRQAAIIAYSDAFDLLAIAALCGIPLAFLFRATTIGAHR
jgi:MFS transporter, DHA2 family, multidrug resistance protein